MEDLYHVLGVGKDASQDDIKKAYRRLAHQHHPDKKGGDEEQFKRVNAAYQVLGDADKRAQYDRFGSTDFNQGGFSGNPFGGGFEGADFQFDFGDIFEQVFGGSRARRSNVRTGEDIAIDVSISFAESARGVRQEVQQRLLLTCKHCQGKGAEPNTPIETCSTCHGSGFIAQSRRTPFGVFSQQQMCPTCHGEGKTAKTPCKQCRGEGRLSQNRTLVIDVPGGIHDGQTIRLSGKGQAAIRGGQAGDLYATVHVEPHPTLIRQDGDVHVRQEISFVDAILGSTVQVPTIEGSQTLTIPAGTQPGAQLRLPGQGFPSLNGLRQGDEVVTIAVTIPKKVSKQQRQLLEEFKKKPKKHSLFG